MLTGEHEIFMLVGFGTKWFINICDKNIFFKTKDTVDCLLSDNDGKGMCYALRSIVCISIILLLVK